MDTDFIEKKKRKKKRKVVMDMDLIADAKNVVDGRKKNPILDPILGPALHPELEA
jgi:hypothetical protein